MKAKVGDIIEWDFKGHSDEKHFPNIYQAKVSAVFEDCYGVYAEYGQDLIPFESARIKTMKEQDIEITGESIDSTKTTQKIGFWGTKEQSQLIPLEEQIKQYEIKSLIKFLQESKKLGITHISLQGIDLLFQEHKRKDK